MSELKILKKATCPTLTGKSRLTYMVGCDEDSEVFVRIYSNDGGGFFSTEWVALKDIQKALSKDPENITSVALFGLFRGKSVNTSGFALAALRNEGLVRAIKGKKRRHELADTKAFMDRIDKLITGDAKPKTTRKKAAVKRKATPRKRATR